MSEEPLAVDMKGVTRIYPGEVNALAGIDLTVAFGESVAITGPSGCGKSTLLHLLAAIDTPTSGSVTVAGHDLARLHNPSEYRRTEVGLVFQFHNLLPQLSALANVELPMFGTHLSTRQRKARARELLADVDLSGREQRLPTELSGGERQRVAIAVGPGQRTQDSACRRAHRQPRFGVDHALPGAPRSARLCWDDHCHGDSRIGCRSARTAHHRDARRNHHR